MKENPNILEHFFFNSGLDGRRILYSALVGLSY